MRILLSTVLLAVFVVLPSSSVVAQESPDGLPAWADPPPPRAPSEQAQPPGLPGDPNQVPVNGLLALLAVAGGAYAVRRLTRAES